MVVVVCIFRRMFPDKRGSLFFFCARGGRLPVMPILIGYSVGQEYSYTSGLYHTDPSVLSHTVIGASTVGYLVCARVL